MHHLSIFPFQLRVNCLIINWNLDFEFLINIIKSLTQPVYLRWNETNKAVLVYTSTNHRNLSLINISAAWIATLALKCPLITWKGMILQKNHNAMLSEMILNIRYNLKILLVRILPETQELLVTYRIILS